MWKYIGENLREGGRRHVFQFLCQPYPCSIPWRILRQASPMVQRGAFTGIGAYAVLWADASASLGWLFQVCLCLCVCLSNCYILHGLKECNCLWFTGFFMFFVSLLEIHLRSQNGKMKLSGREVRLFAAYIDARSRKLSFSSIAIFPPGSVPCLDLLNSVGF